MHSVGGLGVIFSADVQTEWDLKIPLALIKSFEFLPANLISSQPLSISRDTECFFNISLIVGSDRVDRISRTQDNSAEEVCPSATEGSPHS